MNDAFPFAREAGVRDRPSNADSFQAWVELMEAVEALCPRWPERPPGDKGRFLL